jgi:Flp pilus assembly protein TadG
MMSLFGSSRFSADSIQHDRGSTVIETALMIPVLLGVTMVFLTTIQLGITAVQLTDTAHDLARALARGESQSQINEQANVQAPSAQLTLSNTEASVTVTLSQDIDVPIPILSRFSFTFERSATAPLEQM